MPNKWARYLLYTKFAKYIRKKNLPWMGCTKDKQKVYSHQPKINTCSTFNLVLLHVDTKLHSAPHTLYYLIIKSKDSNFKSVIISIAFEWHDELDVYDDMGTTYIEYVCPCYMFLNYMDPHFNNILSTFLNRYNNQLPMESQTQQSNKSPKSAPLRNL